MTPDVRISAAAYPLDWFESWSDYERKLGRWVAEAAEAGADLLVFPEYGLMELASLGGAEVAGDLEASLQHVAALNGDAIALHQRLAKAHGVHMLCASGPAEDGARPVNRATFVGPDGILGHQDKQIMTRFEREDWNVVGGGPLVPIDTPLGRIGVLICYDVEFPLLGRALVEAGAEIILVPSCTETPAGFARVRVGAMARALEGQCVTVHSATVGPAQWCPAVDENHGCGAIYTPPDRGWPTNGILCETPPNRPGWAVADISRSHIRQTRADGMVLNYRDWDEQAARLDAARRANVKS